MRSKLVVDTRHVNAAIVQLSVCLLTASLAACSGGAGKGADESTSSTEGRRYIQTLVGAIESADRIVVTEHSFELDAYDMEQQKPLLDEPVIYATKELSKEQIASFKATIAGLDPVTQDAFAACIFAPHHTVTFFSSGKQESSMHICFECAQVEWKVTSVTPPWSLYGGLSDFVSSIGLQPDRDWRALALEHVK